MNSSSEVQAPVDRTPKLFSPWRLISWICVAVIVLSVLLCIVLAAIRSSGLVQVTVTALDPRAEPRDHDLPLVKQKEALPDYEVWIMLKDGAAVQLGAKPDTSAADGLVWRLSEPVSLADIGSVRLQEQDKLISDAVAEVQIAGNTTTEKGYRFDFVSERSFVVGIQSFFATPIGKAVSLGFCLAVVVALVGFLA